jgi:hypothetical protein
MKTTDYQDALQKAKELPRQLNGELQPHYQMFGDETKFDIILSADIATKETIFDVLNRFKSGRGGKYYKTIPTYHENGNLKPQKEWKKILMFHKKWARVDKEVTGVNYEIVGIKRQTTKLPAGVLLKNITFTID